MSALAELRIEVSDDGEQPAARSGRSASPEPSLLQGAGSARPGRTLPVAPRWNVLAEELVSYPPAHRRIFLDRESFEAERWARRLTGAAAGATVGSYGELWLEGERCRLRERVAAGLASGGYGPSLAAGSCRSTVPADPDRPSGSSLVPDHRHGVRPPTAPLARRAHDAPAAAPRRLPTAGAAAAEPRGLRRLLPGVATLAVLVGLWFGVGSLASVHRPVLAVVPGSVKVRGGYEYVARPGDTLWSIAAALQPGGDPRPIVARLEAEIGGGPLLPGDRLFLP